MQFVKRISSPIRQSRFGVGTPSCGDAQRSDTLLVSRQWQDIGTSQILTFLRLGGHKELILFRLGVALYIG